MSARWAEFVVNPPSSSATRRASMKSGLELKIATRCFIADSDIETPPRQSTPQLTERAAVSLLDLGPTRAHSRSKRSALPARYRLRASMRRIRTACHAAYAEVAS